MKTGKFSLLQLYILLLSVLFFSCNKDKDEDSYTKEKVEGVSQKGPFVNGSSITISELDKSLNPSGKNFNAQIIDNKGSFQVPNIKLTSPFVSLKVDGFYYNEVSGQNSQAPITLYALSDITHKSALNVNLLSHLEKGRIESLVSKGSTFAAAKKQAQKEVLSIFSITKSDIPDAELLDISKSGDENAILLAVSVILQGYRTEAELSQLLGDINTDIREDGVLNSKEIGSALINDTKLFNPKSIRSNIENKYASMGVTASIPDFEKYINNFISNSNYTYTKKITYPKSYEGRPNVIADTSWAIEGGQEYNISAYLPKGTSIKVVFKPKDGYTTSAFFSLMGNKGWTVSHSPDYESTILEAIGNNEFVNIPLMFGPPTYVDFFIYENGATTPTFTKTIGYQ